MSLAHHFQGQKVKLQGAGAYCGGLPHSLFVHVSLLYLLSIFICGLILLKLTFRTWAIVNCSDDQISISKFHSLSIDKIISNV